MNSKYNINSVRKIFLDNGYLLISNTYEKYHQQLIFKDKYGYLYYAELSKIINKKEVGKFGKHNPYTIQNIKLWCELNNKPYKLLSNKYISPHDDLEWLCLKDDCGETFKMPWSRASQNGGCGYCHGKQIGTSNCLASKRPDLANQWHPTKNNGLTPYDITYSSRKDIWWLCKECGHEWCVKPNSRSCFNSGCPQCNKSKGEKRIREYLENNYILFEIQKKYNGLVGVSGGNLSYDFYLPDYNLLIEFQGKQHKNYIKGFHKSKKDFEKQQEHDRRKYNYAKSNNIKILEIWYYDFDNIEEILTQNILLIK